MKFVEKVFRVKNIITRENKEKIKLEKTIHIKINNLR